MKNRDETIFSYNKLWSFLASKNLKRKDLIAMTGISPTVLAGMTKGEPGVNIGDIVEYKGNGSDS